MSLGLWILLGGGAIALLWGWISMAGIIGHLSIPPQERIRLSIEVAKVAAGAFGGLGLIVTLFYTARTYGLNQQGQFTERFSHATEQLGATTPAGDPNVEVRMGGIFALERLARDSKADSRTVIEILSAYVRRNAPWQGSIGPAPDPCGLPREPVPQGTHPRPDIQAAITVIGRRPWWQSERPNHIVDLAATDLRGADLADAHLARANLGMAALDNARLERADLRDADLRRASFTGATLTAADLRNRTGHFLLQADFRRADLEGAILRQTELHHTCFRGANMRRADAEGAAFLGANLSDAQIYCAKVAGADLRNALGLTPIQLVSLYGLEKARYAPELDPRKLPTYERDRRWIQVESDCLKSKELSPRR